MLRCASRLVAVVRDQRFNALPDKQCERNDDEAARIRGLSRMQFRYPLEHQGLA